MSFIGDIIKAKNKLNKLGHKASIPCGTKPHQKDSAFVDNLKGNMEFCIKNNVMKKNFNLIAENNAILVLNYKKNGINGYIGISVLMEMAVAYHLNKKIFLLNKTPHFNKFRWAHEVAIMRPVILGGNFDKIK